MDKKIRITVLDMQPIDPPIGGGRIRLLGLYSGMPESVEVTYIGTFDWRGCRRRIVRHSDNLTELDIPLSDEHFGANDRLSALVGKNCIDTAFSLLGNLSEEYMEQAIRSAREADIVIFSHPWLFRAVSPVLDSRRQLVVYDSQNCEGLLRQRLLDTGTRAADEVLRSVVQNEHDLCRAAERILACSEEDRDAFVRLYGVEPDRISLVPNGVFVSRITPPSEAERVACRERCRLTRPAVCFLGSSYEPNCEAAELIVSAAALLPDIDFLLMGGVGDRYPDGDPLPNVRVTGYLDEQEKLDYLRGCDLAVNPMLSGSGTNIKMFDFMAAGLPVIAPDIGARGIPNTNAEVYRLCERSAESLAREITSLLSDEALRGRLSAGGRREAEVRYSWEVISRQLGEALEREYRQKCARRERVLMVSTYPPEPCGIGKYAMQQTAWLRENGSDVDIWAIRGNGKYCMGFHSGEDILKLKPLTRMYDRVIIQYHAAFFYEGADMEERIRRHWAFAELLRESPNIEIMCHELTFPIELYEKGLLSRGEEQTETEVVVEKWKDISRIFFHTKKERAVFARVIGLEETDPRLSLIDPGRFYTKNRDISRAQARAELGISADAVVFLCIGFVQEHKAFHRAAEAFRQMANNGTRELHIVGSVRVPSAENLAYLEYLRSFDGKNGIHIHPGYVSDEAFDTWLIACDCVLLPYSVIWTSGVLARAKLFRRPCIVHRVGALEEQAAPGDRLFSDYAEFPALMESLPKE